MVSGGEGADRCGGAGAGCGRFRGGARSRDPYEPALPPPTPSSERAGTVEIEFATGNRMRITGSVDASTVSALIKMLAKSKRRR